MLDKDYLDKLKEEDYIAWSELTRDPVTGLKEENAGCLVFFLSAVFVAILVVMLMII